MIFHPFPIPIKPKPEILDLLTQIRLSPVSRSHKEVMDRISQSRTSRNQEVFWISDLQKSTLGQVSKWDSLSKLHLVPIQFGRQSNVFVDSAYLENPFSAGGGKNVLHVRFATMGKRREQLNLKLTLNDIQAATSAINIPQRGVTETTLTSRQALSGLNKAKILLMISPVSFDNEFYLALNFTG